MSQLETYMIVAERVFEVKNIISGMNPENISAYELAYAIERYNTAVVWSRFYDMSGQKYVMDADFLKSACSKKLAEAEERLNYLEVYYPDDAIRDDLNKAYAYYAQKDYALCIFTASKVKADSDIVLSAIFVPDSNNERLFGEKIAAARRVIVKQKNANIFPILGYSYYEYALTLKNTDMYSALLYAEYSLELSNLDMYFKKRDALMLSVPPSSGSINFYLFTLGVSVGILVSVFVFVSLYYFRLRRPKRKSSRK
jgi:predicted S18 family serine protease